jgi:hypothetical protein
MTATGDKEIEILRQTVEGKFSYGIVANKLTVVSLVDTPPKVHTLTARKIIEQLVKVEALCNKSLSDKLKARSKEKDGPLADSVSKRIMNFAATFSKFAVEFQVWAIAF